MEFDCLLEPVSADAPSGIELRYEPRFHAIERSLEPASRQSKVHDDGSLNESAEDVDWQKVLDDAFQLAKVGRDLRLLVTIVRAAARLEGFQGLAGGIAMLTETLERYWDDLHPNLRDRDDPKAAAMARTNALKQLENDDNGLLGDLKFSILLNPRGIGPVTGIELANASLSEFEYLNRVASGLGKSEKEALAAQHGQRVQRVSAACRGLAAEEPERVAAMIAAINKSEAEAASLIAKLSEKVEFGADPVLSLPELVEFLKQARESLKAAVAAIDENETTVETTTKADELTQVGEAPAAHLASLGGTQGVAGTIVSRKDVERCLGMIIDFYERTEPSSPIPHLARRMRRMVPMDFIELMDEIAPSGMKEFRNVAGVDEPKKN